ncbi:MAG: hypothetical protein ACOZQL_09540 [Myxococcota bacterium]
MALLALLCLSAAPVQARFALEVAGAPIAELRVSSDGREYVYEATHFLDEGPRQRRLTFSLARLSAPPEVLTLLSPPATGCRDVLEEVEGRTEQLCVEARSATQARGTLAGAPFSARYVDGALREIEVGNARWVAAPAAVSPPVESPFVRGLQVPDGPLRLEPGVQGARWLDAPPRGLAPPGSAGRERCLLAARRAVAAAPARRRLAIGLVVEDGRAFPHAWIVEGAQALDPSVEAGDELLARRRYLELPPGQRGRLFLGLFDGSVKLVPR